MTKALEVSRVRRVTRASRARKERRETSAPRVNEEKSDHLASPGSRDLRARKASRDPAERQDHPEPRERRANSAFLVSLVTQAPQGTRVTRDRLASSVGPGTRVSGAFPGSSAKEAKAALVVSEALEVAVANRESWVPRETRVSQDRLVPSENRDRKDPKGREVSLAHLALRAKMAKTVLWGPQANVDLRASQETTARLDLQVLLGRLVRRESLELLENLVLREPREFQVRVDVLERLERKDLPVRWVPLGNLDL